MNITFLGTSAMVPTKERNHSGVFIRYKNEGFLVDCGENIQRQFKIAGIKPTKITKILITHWHGDHVFGLPGMLQTLASLEYTNTLEIYGPKGTKKNIENMFKAFIFDREMKIKVNDIKKRKFFENENYYLEALPLEHNIPCIGYSLVEKDKRRIDKSKLKLLKIAEGPKLKNLQLGKSVTIDGKKIKPEQVTYVVKGRKITCLGDTAKCDNCVKLGEDATILISESTYANKLQEKAEEYKHMTAGDASEIANLANVKKLVLTHFSQRYKTTEEILEDAKTTFDNVVCAYDFMKINL